MQKLAIFGDSYAKKDASDIQERSWHDFIDTYEVTNFGEPGTDLWFSYNLFLKNYASFDKVIFLITSPYRITLTNPNIVIYPNQNYTTASVKVETATGKELEQYKAVVSYYEYIRDKEKDEQLHQLMVDNIKRLCPTAIVYPCFKDSWYNAWNHETALYSITEFEDSFLGMNDQIRKEFYRRGLRDSRACHLTEDNNRLVATMFLERLQGKESYIQLDQLIKPKHNLEYYYQSTWH